MKKTPRRNRSSIWIMSSLFSSPARLSSAYTAPLRSGCKKRTLANSSNTIGTMAGNIRVMKDEPPSTRESALSMALDSRELRFYSSSSSTQISRAASSTTTDNNNGRRTTTTKESVSTTVKSMDGSMRFTTTTYASKTTSMGNNNNGVLAPPISIYSSGLANLLNTFDAEFKRAFSQSSTNNAAAAAYQHSHHAHYSTSSSTLFSSLEDVVPRAPNNSRWRKQQQQQQQQPPPPSPIEIDLTKEERELFSLLRQVTNECGMKSTLRVAGGWVRDKILASKEFNYAKSRGKVDLVDDDNIAALPSSSGFKVEMDECGDEVGEMKRITSKFKGEKASPSECLSVTVPVDIDIALDDKLGREFADELNQWLSSHGRERVSVGVVLKNPEKSKHLETATMRINNYWIDFVNLRAEEYTSDSRIPDLMRIGTAEEDAFRRDLTINSLFYNINDGVVEDMTGRGLEDLRKKIVATPLPPLTTLLDDPLRVLRSVRFAARLRFNMDEALRKAAADERVKEALEQKVSRERIGSEVDLMLKSRDPVGAMRLLINIGLIETVFPLPNEESKGKKSQSAVDRSKFEGTFDEGLSLLSTTHDHLCDCKVNPPLWCEARRALEAGAVNGVGKEDTRILMEDEDARRLLWYAAFLKPFRDRTIEDDEDREHEDRKKPRKSKRSAIVTLLVDELKRPSRDADAVDKIMRAADGFSRLLSMGGDVSGLSVLLSELHVIHRGEKVVCTMNGRTVNPNTENDAIWNHCMEFREDCATVLKRIGPLWRAAFILSLTEQLVKAAGSEIEYTIEGDVIDEANEEVVSGILQKYDVFAAAMMNLGLIGIWNQQPLLNGEDIKQSILPRIPIGPAFRDVMDSQTSWMISHPGGSREKLVEHLQNEFEEFT